MNCKAANIIFSRLDIPRYAGVVGTCTLTLTSLLLASVMMVSKRPSVNNTRWLCELWDTWGPYRSWNRDVISSHLVTNRDHVPLRNSNHITLSEHCLFHSFFIFLFFYLISKKKRKTEYKGMTLLTWCWRSCSSVPEGSQGTGMPDCCWQRLHQTVHQTNRFIHHVNWTTVRSPLNSACR